MDGERLAEKLLIQLRELTDQPVATMRTVKEYISMLGKKVALHVLSLDLNKEMAPERMLQLKTMEAEGLCIAWEEGNMAGITHGHRTLRDHLDRYQGSLDVTKDGERVSSDPTGAWQRKATNLTKEIMEKMGGYTERGTDEDDGPLVPLRRATGGIAALAEVIMVLEAEPSEDKLRLLGRDLNEAKGSLMSLGQVLMLSQDPTLAASAHEVVAEAEEAIRVGQQRVRAALRRMGAASDISDTGSLDIPTRCS